MPLDLGTWVRLRDGDRQAFALFRRHYSYYQYADRRRENPGNRNRFQFMGPGEKVVLLTPDGKALFGWRKFKDDSGQQGINCSVFRNEGPARASELILAAQAIAWEVWPGERLYTYVNPAKLPDGKRPGYCFECAGWSRCGLTKSGLLILEKRHL